MPHASKTLGIAGYAFREVGIEDHSPVDRTHGLWQNAELQNLILYTTLMRSVNINYLCIHLILIMALELSISILYMK